MNTLRKFLVVDDDPVIGKSFDRVLSGRGYAVVTAKDGPEALRKMADEAYDVVYTDIRMPGMDGIEVASADQEAPAVASGGDRERLRYGRERGESEGRGRVRRAAQAAFAGDDRGERP